MRVIPSQIFLEDSPPEKKIHELLKQVKFSDYDVALHSLNIGKHLYKSWGEGDFVIISKLGLIVLEVKGKVSCNGNGIWIYTDRYGKRIAKKESPSRQAMTFFNSLKENYLNSNFEFNFLKSIPSGWASVITSVNEVPGLNSSNLPELPYEITAYRRHCRDANAFKSWLKSIFVHYKNNQSQELTKEEVTQIHQFLRPKFDMQPSLGAQIEEADYTLNTFTKQQSKVIIGMEGIPRVIIQGGNGMYDGGTKKLLMKDILSSKVLLKSFSKFKNFNANKTMSNIIFYYGKRSIPKPFSLIRDDLDEHFNFAVREKIEKVNEYFKLSLIKMTNEYRD